MGKTEEKETLRDVPPIEDVKMVGNRPITKKRRTRKKGGKARGRKGTHPPSPSGKTILDLIETLKLPKEGKLNKNPTGLVFLDLDDQWIAGLQTELSKYGYEAPPYFYPPLATGAHVSLLPAGVAEDIGVKDQKIEEGKKVSFKVKKARPTFPTRFWSGMEALYKVWVEGPELDQVARDVTGGEWSPPGGYSIVVGVRPLKKEQKEEIKEEKKREKEEAKQEKQEQKQEKKKGK